MNELPKDRDFQIWDYSVSHGRLLIRSPKGMQFRKNIDIKFFGVQYLSLPRHLKCLTIDHANDEEFESLKKTMGDSLKLDNVHILECIFGRCVVIASHIKVELNELGIFETSIND